MQEAGRTVSSFQQPSYTQPPAAPNPNAGGQGTFDASIAAAKAIAARCHPFADPHNPIGEMLEGYRSLPFYTPCLGQALLSRNILRSGQLCADVSS